MRPGCSSTHDSSPNTSSPLVGSSNEVTVTINEKETLALLDTGSNVSTICRQFYNAHLSDIPIKPLETILQVSVPMDNNFHTTAM